MKDTSKKALRRGNNEGNIRQRTDGRWEVRLSAGIDYKTGKPKRTSTCCNTRQEAIAILQQQAHEVRTQGWRTSTCCNTRQEAIAIMYTNQICIAPPKNSGEKLFFLCSTVHNMFLLAKG